MNATNELVKKPIPKLIRQLAVPASVGFFFNTMYNVTDTFFGGLISTEAVAALSISFPVFFVIIAMGSGISTGASALISNALGAGKQKEAQKFAAQTVSFSIIVSLLLSVVGFFVAPSLFRILGAEGQYLQIALSYINIILLGAVLFSLNFMFNALLNAQGDTKTFRNFLIFGFFLNIGLDPWFIFGGFGLPALGLAGVAWATLLVELVGVVYMGVRTIQSGILCRTCLKWLRPERKSFWEISQQGFPASLNMMTVAIGIFVITYFISPFGQKAVAAYGIATRIDQIALLPSIGLNIAALTLVGQNNGAKKFDRMRKTYQICLNYSFYVLAVGMVAVFLFARPLIGLFSEDLEVIKIGSEFLKISAITYWSYGILYVSVSALQGIKKPLWAVWTGFYRQIVGPIIVFYFLVNVLGWGLHGIWWGVFFINWSAAIFTLIYAKSKIGRLT